MAGSDQSGSAVDDDDDDDDVVRCAGKKGLVTQPAD